MAAESNLRNMVMCLTFVCLFCAAVLGGIYALTLEPIQDAARKALNESISKVLPQSGGTISDERTVEFGGTDYQYYEYTDAEGVAAYAVKSSTSGFGGELSLMVGILRDGTVFNTSVLSHSETPGLGAKCQSDKSFISQWQGFSPDKVLKLKKDGGDVDAITASTITSRAYTLAVSNAVEVVKSITGED